MNIGIDKIGFYIPSLFIDMKELAHTRGVIPEKYTIGLGQEEMAVPPIYEDAVTLAANAALSILNEEDKKAIDLILVGSESGVDNSKSIAVYVQSLVKLSSKVRAIELKQACYGATMALQLAKGHILEHPNSKVLVIASDIAKYGLHTPGEATQGAGAIAMIISSNPKIAIIEKENAFLTEDIMDFWRPIYSDVAFADGKFSTEKYMSFFETVWQDYVKQTGRTFKNFEAICFHQPFTKLGFKTLNASLDKTVTDEQTKQRLLQSYEWSKVYNKRVGNIYTGSLYLSLISLLEHSHLKANSRIGMFSYGSGAVGEFFSLVLQKNYKDYLFKDNHEKLLNNRQQLTIADYENIFSQQLPKNGEAFIIETVPNDRIVLYKLENHIRYYK